MAGAGPVSGDRIGGGKAEIVVGVEFDRNGRASRQGFDQRHGRERVENAHGVGQPDARGGGGGGNRDHIGQMGRIGARGILAADRDGEPEPCRLAHQSIDARKRLGRCPAAELQVGGRQGD
jgi:hypothetical protein